jgi:RNA polymerase sigma factor (sigma-70 family)
MNLTTVPPMSESADLHCFAEPLRRLRDAFSQAIAAHRPALWRYCLGLTGNPWDAEDLVQETLARALGRLGGVWQQAPAKAYLFRIASNLWIDRHRQRQRQPESMELEAEAGAGSETPPVDIEEAMLLLVVRLPARQRVVLLLHDVFGFTGAETAGLIGSTEGAVKAALHRARATLRSTAAQEEPITPAAPLNPATDATVQAFIQAFNRRDAIALAALLAPGAEHQIMHVADELGRDAIRGGSLTETMADSRPLHAKAVTLWGQPAVAVVVPSAGGMALCDLLRLDVSEGQIMRMKTYYFCPELLAFAARNAGFAALSHGYVYRGPE